MDCYAAVPALLSTVDANNRLTAADTLIPQTMGGGDGWDLRAVAPAAASRGECLVRRGGMGALATDDGQSLMTHIMLHVQCVYG